MNYEPKVASQLNVSRSNCVIIINEYDRWVPTLDAVMRFFKIVLPPILKEKSISIIALQYTDMFTWKDDPANLNLREIFTESSPYLAPNVFEQKGLWHCHHGYVIQQLAELEGTCLDNVNVNTEDNLGDRGIQITTTHKFTLSGTTINYRAFGIEYSAMGVRSVFRKMDLISGISALSFRR